MKKFINTDKAPAPIGPYNQAVLSNGTLYVSGQIALDPSTGELKTDDVVKETHQVMDNIKAILEAGEMKFEDVIKCSIFIKDLDYFGAINRAYGEYFDEKIAPARECVEVSRLPKNVNVEISCIAEK
ncbi:MAG: RidA family protein [Cytophagales bacterium]|nr:RidA family protein [Cytophagales bacterium]